MESIERMREQVHFVVNKNFQCHCFRIWPSSWLPLSVNMCVNIWIYGSLICKMFAHARVVWNLSIVSLLRFAGKPKNKHGRKKIANPSFFRIEQRFACLKGRKSHYNMSPKELRKFSYQIIVNWAHQTRCNAQVPPRLSERTCSNFISLTHVFEGKIGIDFLVFGDTEDEQGGKDAGDNSTCCEREQLRWIDFGARKLSM